MIRRFLIRRLSVWLPMLLLVCTAAAADDYPQRPVTLVVTLPPGGPTDAAARTLATALSGDAPRPADALAA